MPKCLNDAIYIYSYLFRVSSGSFLLMTPVSGSTVVKMHLYTHTHTQTMTRGTKQSGRGLPPPRATEEVPYLEQAITLFSFTFPMRSSFHESYRRKHKISHDHF